ncbi:hypothetical protein Tco_1264878 [Tanacetum coccineum]
MSVKHSNFINLDSSSEEHQNKKTSSPPPRKKSLSPPQAPSKPISSKGTHYTSLSSPNDTFASNLESASHLFCITATQQHPTKLAL